MKRFILILFVIFSLSASAQMPDLKWVKKLPFIISAQTTDNEDNIYIAGNFRDTIIFNNTPIFTSGYFDDILLVKYDSAGNLLWYKQVGGLDADFVTDIKIDNDNNVLLLTVFNYNTIIEGDTIPTQENNHRPLLVKYTKDGDFLWWKIPAYTVNGCFHPKKLNVDKENNIILTANNFYGSSIVFPDSIFGHDSLNSHDYIAKYNSDGVFKWVRRYYQTIYQTTIDANNNILLIKKPDTNYTGNDFLKLSPEGNTIWKRKLNAKISVPILNSYIDNYISLLSTDRFNNSYFTGTFSDTITIGSECYISKGYEDIIQFKFDTAGLLKWAIPIGGPSNEIPQSLLVNGDKILLLGTFIKKIYFTEDSISAPGPVYSTNSFIVQYDLNGQSEKVTKIVGRKYSGIHSDLISMSKSIYLGSTISDTSYIGDTVLIDHNLFAETYYLLRFYNNPPPPQPIVEDFEIYPNPTRGTVNFNFNSSYGEVTLQIYDLRGALVKTYILSQTHNSLDLGFLSHGLYIARLISSEKVQCARFEKL